jgi:hypothetical protein
VLAGLIIPPAVVPTIWVREGLGLFRAMFGLILIEVGVRHLAQHPAVPGLHHRVWAPGREDSAFVIRCRRAGGVGVRRAYACLFADP